jgi:hypothetical protein
MQQNAVMNSLRQSVEHLYAALTLKWLLAENTSSTFMPMQDSQHVQRRLYVILFMANAHISLYDLNWAKSLGVVPQNLKEYIEGSLMWNRD